MKDNLSLHELFLSTNSNPSSIPRDVTPRTSVKEKLVIIGDPSKTDSLLLDCFPFYYYNVIGWITKTDSFSYVDSISDESGLFLNCDRILLKKNVSKLCNDLVDKYKVNREICITYTENINNHSITVNYGTLNKEKTIIVIVPDRFIGIMYNLQRFLGVLDEYANKCIYVDMQNFRNQCMPESHLGLYNVWDYYFKPGQCSSDDLDEIYHSFRVVMRNPRNFNLRNSVGSTTKWNLNLFSERILSMYDEERRKLSSMGKNILGIYLRGTDYKIAVFHRTPLDGIEITKYVDSIIFKRGIDGIYLMTDDEDNYRELKKYYGEKLYALSHKRFCVQDFQNEHSGAGKSLLTPKDCYLEFRNSMEITDSYVLGTLLVSSCDHILITPGPTATVFMKLLKRTDVDLEELPTKGINSYWGTNPLTVVSESKNYFNFVPPKPDETPLQITYSKGIIGLEGNIGNNKKILLFTCTDPHFNCFSHYYISINIYSGQRPELEFVFYDYNGLTSSCAPDNTIAFTSSIKKYELFLNTIDNDYIDSSFSIQIESGLFPTEFEPNDRKVLQLGIFDRYGLPYDKDIKSINFNEGYFIVGNKKIALSPELQSLYNNIYHYPSGHLYYIYNNQVRLSLSDLSDLTIEDTAPDYVDWSWIESMKDSNASAKAEWQKIPIRLYESKQPRLVNEALRFIDMNDNPPLSLLTIKSDYILKTTGNYDEVISIFKFYSKNGKNNQMIIHLLQYLWNCGTRESIMKYIDVASYEYENNDNLKIADYLARPYFEGKYVPIDYHKVYSILKPAKEFCNPVIFFDSMWLLKDTEVDKEMFVFALGFFKSNNKEMIARLGRCYRDGRGTSANMGAAVDCFKVASAKNLPSAKINYFDSLWVMNTPESIRTMVDFASDECKKGNLDLCIKLAKAYRVGKGVPKDLVKSANLLRKCISKKDVAVIELSDVLLEINSPKSIEEMIQVLEAAAKKGNGEAMARLGRAYRDGIGVPANHEKAIEMFEGAIALHISWIQSDYDELLNH